MKSTPPNADESLVSQLRRGFDAELVVRAGDDALIARSAAGVAMPGASARKRPRSALFLALAATLVVASAAAAGAVVARDWHTPFAWFRSQAPGAALATKPDGTARQPGATGHDTPRAATPSDAPSDTPTSASLAVSSSAGAPREPLEHPAARASTAPHAPATLGAAERQVSSAASLFRDASNARRAGDFAGARALYTELQTRFPGTSEARVSQVSLGKLLLAAGRAREALGAFRAYAAAGGGDLAEEALLGRASALAALGEKGEERRAWQELLGSYPTSVYRERAEARVAALERALAN